VKQELAIKKVLATFYPTIQECQNCKIYKYKLAVVSYKVRTAKYKLAIARKKVWDKKSQLPF